MLLFSPAKINIGLNITGKRPDGYHNIQTVFYPLPFFDAVECVQAKYQTEPLQLNTGGISIPGPDAKNLCVRAFQLLKKDFPDIPPLKAHLFKTIPAGGGLGGGSSNGVAMFKLINEVAELNLTREQIFGYALQLGSDCPFFVDAVPALATGRGEALKPIQVNLSDYNILLVNAGISVSTQQAFAALTTYQQHEPFEEWISLPPAAWKGKFQNHFEAPVFHMHPELRAIKTQLIQSGAVYASLTGTGGTLYGIFPKIAPQQVSFPEHYFLKWC